MPPPPPSLSKPPGANDVANAFATSVGAKTLKMWHAVVLAIIFEFTGAIVLGRVVTGVIAGGIANIQDFQSVPEVYAYGMVIALTIGFLWQWWASWKGLNVSATHSIIAAIMGFSLVWNGLKGVNWATPDPSSFPPYKGVVPIICSWFISPILTGFASGLLFLTLRHTVLRRKNGAFLSLFVLPVAVFITFFVNIFFVFTKGAKKLLTSTEKDWTDAKAAWIAASCAAVISVLSAVIVVPILNMRMKKFFDAAGNPIKDSVSESTAGGAMSKSDIEKAGTGSIAPGTGGAQDVLGRMTQKEIATNITESWQKRWWRKAVAVSTRGVTYDIHDQIEEDPVVAAIHAHAEKFAPSVEFAFGYLQVFSAICVIFAHGAGEVGYMAGPLATVYEVWQTGSLPHYGGKLGNVQSPLWIVAICASGLVVGLATFGHYVMRAMGTALAKLSPTRGFCAELATSLVILVASQLGLPTSSSQCIIGAIVGVGLMEGIRAGVNWKLFGAQFASWVVTMFVCGGVTAALFAQGVYTPSKIDGQQVAAYQKALMSATNATTTSFNNTLYSFQDAAAAGAIPGLDQQQFDAYAANTAKLNKQLKTWKDPATPQSSSIKPAEVLKAYQQSLQLTANNTVNTLGQTTVYPGAQLCNGPSLADIQGNTRVECKAPTW